MDWKSIVAPYGANTAKEYSAAAIGALGGAFGAPAQAFTGYAQGLAGLGSAYANNYGHYASAMGNVANSQANNAGNQYSARAMAEAARQGALGNIGSAALGAYGSNANSAMSAWAQNQMAYNKSLSEMQQANQSGMSNYGVSRNQALAGLANAYGSAGGQLGSASALGNISASFGDGGFNANGFNASGAPGQIASGTYGPSSGGFYGSLTRTSNNSGVPDIASKTFGGLDDTRKALMSEDIMAALMRDADIGRTQLDAQHYTSRGMPMQMMDGALGGLMALSRDAYGNSSGGMDQFYDSLARSEESNRRNLPDYSTVMGGLASGFLHSGDQITGLRGDMGTGFNNTRGDLQGLFGSRTPAEELRQQREADLLRQQYSREDKMRRQADRPYGMSDIARQAQDLMAKGYKWNGATGGWTDSRGRPA